MVEIQSLLQQFLRCTRVELRYVSRLNFFTRVLEDIEADFHKQYGAHYRDWEQIEDLCCTALATTEEYLQTRDLVMIDIQLRITQHETASTSYAQRKLERRVTQLLDACFENDVTTLYEIDQVIEHIKQVQWRLRLAELEEEE